MICDPSQNNINVGPIGPPPALPGLIPPFSVGKIPFPDVSIPPGIPEDIIDLIDRLTSLFPQGIRFVPNADALTKEVWDALASLFNQLAPFLAFYKFIQALLNIILCIIDVLCALLNPFATIRAIKRLMKQCIPDFLSLFPWIALLIMILSLILLLIALIEYIINAIADYIRQIIENIKILIAAAQRFDEESILAATNKLAYLFCLIEQLFAIFLALAAILAVIKPLMSLGGRGVCSRGRASRSGTDIDTGDGTGDSDIGVGMIVGDFGDLGGDIEPDSCCTDDFCPQFIFDESITSTTGRFMYQPEISADIPSDPSFNFLRNIDLSPQRREKWQIYDASPGETKFLDIITPSPEFDLIYWPSGITYTSGTSIKRVPYLLDMTLSLDPRYYGNPSDLGGTRLFKIENIIVKREPTTYPEAWNNQNKVTNPISGALFLGGGKVYEMEDGDWVSYYIGGSQATMETLITKTSSNSSIPATDDTSYFNNVTYVLHYNYEVLADNRLITVTCQPSLAAETVIVNAEYEDIRDVSAKIGRDLPDIGSLNNDRTGGTGALGDLAAALTAFRQDVNEESALKFQEDANNILNNLRDDSIDYYVKGLVASVDRFGTAGTAVGGDGAVVSGFSLSPEIQFVGLPIQVSIRLLDKTGTILSTNLPADIATEAAKLIAANPTFGELGPFEYDGSEAFVANINSDVAGTGEITATVNNESVVEIINRDNEDLESQIIEKVLTYEFIDKTSQVYGSDGSVIGSGDAKVRFNESDVAKDGS